MAEAPPYGDKCEYCGTQEMHADYGRISRIKFRRFLCPACYHDAKVQGIDFLFPGEDGIQPTLRTQFEVLAAQQTISPEVIDELRKIGDEQAAIKDAAVKESIANYRAERVAGLLRELIDVPSDELYRISESLVVVANEVPEDPKDVSRSPIGEPGTYARSGANPCQEVSVAYDGSWRARRVSVTPSVGTLIHTELARRETVKAGDVVHFPFTWTAEDERKHVDHP